MSVAAVVLLAAVAATVMLVMGHAQRSALEADYSEAVEELAAAEAQLADAIELGQTEVERSRALLGVVTADHVDDAALIDEAESAAVSFESQVETVAVPEAPTGGAVGEMTDEELATRAAELRSEAAKASELALEFEQHSGALIDAQKAVLASVQQGGEAAITEAAGHLSEDVLAALRSAIDALSFDLLVEDGADVAAALASFTEARDEVRAAVKAATAPSWEDINGTWCGRTCISINLPRVDDEATITSSGHGDGCFSGSVLPDTGPGGAAVLYCPAGVPTPPHDGSLVTNEDESRDRLLFYQAPGGSWMFRQ